MNRESQDGPETRVDPTAASTTGTDASLLPARLSTSVVEPALPFYIVGLGASAGGLEALERFFLAVPADTGMAFVVVQHLSPDHKSLMAELLSRYTTMGVTRVDDGEPVLPNHVYLIPPKKNIVLERGCLRLADKPPGPQLNLPIDIFFRSMAAHQRERCVSIVLSGTGSDGVHGIGAVKDAGGIVMVQDIDSSRFDGMPRSAAATGTADYVLPPEEMPERLLHYIRSIETGSGSSRHTNVRPDNQAFIELMEILRTESGVDFTHYKPNTILRRIERRMEASRMSRLEEYVHLLRRTPLERTTLFKELLIGVTRFFRDPEVFECLREQVIAPLIQRTPEKQTLRIWVAGCSTGEEAYSISILFLEELKQAGKNIDFKIFATDIDQEALEVASAASYPDSSLVDVGPERLANYFERRGDEWVVTRKARQPLLFTRHNVFRDPPFTRLDLVTCRNLLIYLDPTLQRRVFSLFHFALKPAGALLLGTSETVGEMVEHFRPLDSRKKIYEVTGAPYIPLGDTIQIGLQDARNRAISAPQQARSDVLRLIDRVTTALLAEFAPACVLVDEYFTLVHVFGDVSPFIKVQHGSPTLNLLKMSLKPLSTLLAAAVPRVLRQGRESKYVGIEIPNASGHLTVNVRVRPLLDLSHHSRYLLVMFECTDRPESHSPSSEEVRANERNEQQIVDLQLELQHSRESLQAMVEELEASNEELQATNEELLASNEELQSTNEELQSVNEELHTVNAEYEQKISDLVDLNNDIDNLLRSTDLGTLFLDDQLQVRRFTPAVTEYISVLDRDIGRPIEHLAIHLWGEGFLEDIRTVLITGKGLERPEIRNNRRHVLVRIMPYVAQGGKKPSGAVITFVDVSSAVRVSAQLKWVLDSLPERVALLDAQGVIQVVNERWSRYAAEHAGERIYSGGVGQNYIAALADSKPDSPSRDLEQVVRDGIRRVLNGELPQFTHEYERREVTGGGRSVMNVVLVKGSEGVVVSYLDITQYPVP